MKNGEACPCGSKNTEPVDVDEDSGITEWECSDCGGTFEVDL